MALADYDDSHLIFRSSISFLSTHSAPARHQTLSLSHTQPRARCRRFQANCHIAHAINTVFKHTSTSFSSANISFITTQLTMKFPHQHTCTSTPRLFLFNHHLSGSSSANLNTSISPPVTARVAVRHRSLTKQHLIASLPTGTAPLSQQQALRHFLTNNHLVISPSTNTSLVSFLHRFSTSDTHIYYVQTITHSSTSLFPY